MGLKMFFAKPHPFVFNKYSLVVIGVVTFILLAILAPLGYDTLPFNQRLALAAINALIASTGVWLTILLVQKAFPKWSKPEKWTIGKEILLILFGVFNIIVLTFLFLKTSGITTTPSIELFVSVVFKTLAISILPICLMVFFEQYSYQRKKLKQALTITELLKKRNFAKGQEDKNILVLCSENGNVDLQLYTNELVYMKSEGNYIDVFYLPKGAKTPQKKLIRNSLKTMTTVLPVDSFFQCHKSYIINLNQIVQVQGNARNLELSLRYVKETIPVSRAKSKLLQELLYAST